MIEPAKMTVGGWNEAWVLWAEKRIAKLETENKALREAAQAVVDKRSDLGWVKILDAELDALAALTKGE